MDYKQIALDVKEIAIKAGEKILEIYNSPDFEVETKADNSPITNADRAANTYIVTRLNEKYPDFGMLSEELKDTAERLSTEYVWVVDPLDGTKEFIKRNGEFTVNIGLVKNGEPVVGVVTIPVKQEAYFASKGDGAFYQGPDKKIKQVMCSKEVNFEKMVLVKSRSHASEKLINMIETYKFADVKDCGSSIKVCLIAHGTAHIYFRFGGTNEWDICAAHCVLNEAGGKMTDCSGNSISYNKKDPLNRNGFIASNNTVHEKFVEIAEKYR